MNCMATPHTQLPVDHGALVATQAPRRHGAGVRGTGERSPRRASLQLLPPHHRRQQAGQVGALGRYRGSWRQRRGGAGNWVLRRPHRGSTQRNPGRSGVSVGPYRPDPVSHRPGQGDDHDGNRVRRCGCLRAPTNALIAQQHQAQRAGTSVGQGSRIQQHAYRHGVSHRRDVVSRRTHDAFTCALTFTGPRRLRSVRDPAGSSPPLPWCSSPRTDPSSRPQIDRDEPGSVDDSRSPRRSARVRDTAPHVDPDRCGVVSLISTFHRVERARRLVNIAALLRWQSSRLLGSWSVWRTRADLVRAFPLPGGPLRPAACSPPTACCLGARPGLMARGRPRALVRLGIETARYGQHRAYAVSFTL